MYSPLIVADYLLGTHSIQLTPLQANKLTYIAHGFTLALHDTKLVREPVEAWKYGPVFPSLYYALREFGGDNISALNYCSTKIDDGEINSRMKFLKTILGDRIRIIDMVIETYGKLSGSRLIELTHEKGTPWHKFYRKNERGIIIPTRVIKEHYKDIINGDF